MARLHPVLELTYQLAAHLIETPITPLEDLGRLAVISVLRTMLGYSPERVIVAMAERDQANDRRGKS
jgi:uncharacterized membrane protein